MVPCDERVLVGQDDADPGPSTMVCGFWTGICQTNNQWRETLVLILHHTPEIAELFDPGPGRSLEIGWWTGSVVANGPVVVFCSIATQSALDVAPRRFTIIIPTLPPFVEEFADADVFALTLSDEDESDDSFEDRLMWFVENDPGTWASLPPQT